MGSYIVVFNSGCYRVMNVAQTRKRYSIVTTNRILAAAIWSGTDYKLGLPVAAEANQKRKGHTNDDNPV